MKSVLEMLKEKPLGMDLTVPRARTLPIMTIIHHKTVQGGINSVHAKDAGKRSLRWD
jgi:hypothetical protein